MATASKCDVAHNVFGDTLPAVHHAHSRRQTPSAPAGNAASQPRSTVARRLNELFATVTYLHGWELREYSTPYVAKTISEDPAHDTKISRVYLNGLRNGTNTNPTVSIVRAIAKFFDEHRSPETPPITGAYLLGEDDAMDRALRERLADHQVRRIAMRASSMDDRTRKQVLHLIDKMGHGVDANEHDHFEAMPYSPT